ncbi:unnamed protein product [Heterobilharzia americana]|nr:unnamed protein product [Heterobilharzia americana]
MASSSTIEGMSISKGEEILVKVEDLAGELISVKLVSGDRTFRGILLRENTGKQNVHGTNPERIIGSPFWPPFSGAAPGINLKTIPCSTERYSYKLEGQSSNLNVFQPDPSKRSHRHQPAPQLSRILRPRRFVCRKCKKAFHLEEQGTELSSTVLTDQLDRRTSDSSALNSDSEVSHCLLKSEFPDQNMLALLNGNSQSIRHVTPSIIPKLNEEIEATTSDSSKAHIVSSTEVQPKPKKHLRSEQSPKTSESLETKSTVLKKRKVDAVLEKPKLKKMKLSSQKSTEQVNLSSAPASLITDQVSDSVAHFSTEGAKNPPVSPNSVPNLPVGDSLSQEQIRRNRIKAQYVSVASPFRFPFGKKSKISHTQVSGSSGSVSDSKIKSEANSNRMQSEKPAVHSVTSPKPNLSGVRQNSRYRTRTQLNSVSIVPEPLDLPDPVNSMEECPHTSEVSPQPTQGIDSSQKESNSSNLSPHMSSSQTVSSKEKHSTSVQLTCKISTSGHSSISNNTGISTSDGNFSPQGRRKAFDYEKPKNRWMREARARRGQEERSNSLMSSATNHGTASSNSTDMDYFTATNVQSSSLGRLRIRSGDGLSATSNETASKVSNSALPKAKLPNGPLNNRSTELTDCSQIEKYSNDVDHVSASISHVSPCLPSSTENSGLTLPVLKIKINRSRQPSSCSKSAPTQYEVVKFQATDIPSETAVSASEVSNEEACSIANADTSSSPVSKSDIPCNGVCSPSSSPSVESSKKGFTGDSSVVSGPLVKHCKLTDGSVFRVGDLVWSKLSGWPYWPAQITSIQRVTGTETDSSSPEQEKLKIDSQEKLPPISTTEQGCYTACLHWFAWHQVSYMPCDKLFHFLEHCKRFDNKKKRGVFRQAVNEAKQASEKRQEIHPSDSGSEWEHEAVGDTCGQPAIDQPSETCITDSSKQSLEISQPESSFLVSDANLAQEADTITTTTTRMNISPSSKIKKGKRKDSHSKRKSSVTCTIVDSLNTSLGTATTSEQNHQNVTSKTLKSRTVSRRGSKRQGQSIMSNNSEEGNLSSNEYDSLTSSESSVRLKIILSKPKSKSRLNRTEIVRNETQSPHKNEVHSSCSENLDLLIAENNQPQTVIDSSTQALEDPNTSEPNQKSNLSTTGSQDMDRSFSATHSELLTQFPHVFPDLKVSGILSDTVDIPTFSEDESEEEDAGRLIIDPDVMASVNVPLSTNNHYITESLKQEPDILREDLYSLSSTSLSYNREPPPQHTFGNVHSYSQASLASISDHPVPSFVTPVYSSSDSFPHHSYNSSAYSTECLISQSVPVYPLLTQSSIASTVSRLSSPHLKASDLSNLPIPDRTSYFQSSHLRVPSTTAQTVPYITTEYSTL